MPFRGYKKPEGKTVTLRFRVAPKEAEALHKASEKAKCRGFSEWVRVVMLAEAERVGIVIPSDSK